MELKEQLLSSTALSRPGSFTAITIDQPDGYRDVPRWRVAAAILRYKEQGAEIVGATPGLAEAAQ